MVAALAIATLALAAGVTTGIAAPASAVDIPTVDTPTATPPTVPNAAFRAWLDDTSTTSDTASAGLPTPAATTSASPTGGERITDKHGGPLLWTANTLEWYFTSSKITSSSGSQSDGYVFPNTASKGGIKRTLKTSAEHNWRGTMIVGEGTVTPWGDVDLFKTSRTDYYELLLKGKFKIS